MCNGFLLWATTGVLAYWGLERQNSTARAGAGGSVQPGGWASRAETWEAEQGGSMCSDEKAFPEQVVGPYYLGDP